MKKKLSIAGMTCGHCVSHVTKALESVSGVTSVDVELEKNSALIEADESVTAESVEKAVKAAGYSVTAIEADGGGA